MAQGCAAWRLIRAPVKSCVAPAETLCAGAIHSGLMIDPCKHAIGVVTMVSGAANDPPGQVTALGLEGVAECHAGVMGCVRHGVMVQAPASRHQKGSP